MKPGIGEIRALNDLARRRVGEWVVHISAGVLRLGGLADILRQISSYRFDDHGDPDDAHDFGAVWIDDQAIFWAVQCYQDDLVTPVSRDCIKAARVLRIELDEEYLGSPRSP